VTAERVERRLAAIFAGDVAVYSRLMGQDETGTLKRLRALRRELADPEIAEHKGRIVKTTGDGRLVEFPSVVEAVGCAVATQRGISERNAEIPTDLSAYDLYLRALAALFQLTKERVVEALGLLDQAIAIDRHYGPALSWAAICHQRFVNDGWAPEPETARRKAVDLARQALQVGRTTRASLPMPPRCWLDSARISAR
jgi:hypothetical protein